MATRKELALAVGERYRASTRRQRRAILDEFVRLTGYHRKHAIRVLTTPPMAPVERACERVYDEAVRQTLIVLWEAADRICGKRLKALMPTLIEAMENHKHLQLEHQLRAKLLAVSAATIDRALSETRVKATAGRRRRSGVGSAIRQSVPVRTFADWNEPPPGYFEIDLVEHCGGVKEGGNYVHSLVLTDIATGWTECVALPVREQTLIVTGLTARYDQLPFPMRGIDSDNDSAFMNETVRDFCQERGIEWTRSRAYKKNDQAWVEQKNGAIVRRLVGYGRLSGVAATAALAQLYANARRKHYHPPLTPYQRLLATGAPDHAMALRLRDQFAVLDPVALLKSIRDAQGELAKHAGGGSDASAPVITDVATFLQSLGTAWKTGEVRPTHQHKRKISTPRTWRTRVDPFAATWPMLVAWLGKEPQLTAKELMCRLRGQLPDLYPTGSQLRTLQRRLKTWRTEKAKALVLGAMPTHTPSHNGEHGASQRALTVE